MALTAFLGPLLTSYRRTLQTSYLEDMSYLEDIADVTSVSQVAEDGEDDNPGEHRGQGVHHTDQESVPLQGSVRNWISTIILTHTPFTP